MGENHSASKKTTNQKTSLIQKFRGNVKYQKYLFVYTCLLLPILFFIGIRILPTLFTFNVGFRDWNLLATGIRPFIGLENYQALIQDKVFIKSAVNTLIYIVLGVSGQLFFGIIVALLLHKINRFVGFFRVIYFISAARISSAARMNSRFATRRNGRCSRACRARRCVIRAGCFEQAAGVAEGGFVTVM